MKKWIPFPAYADDAPLDISFVFKNEAPAGKHGFMRVQGDRFVFEDGAPARFWGTNFNSGGNFPSHEYSRKVARRLSKFGVNLVRFHQMDAQWASPNIFQFEKGTRQKDSLSLDPRSLDRLDYLVYCLKEQGIYCYLDLLTYRKFKSGDGVENAHLLDDSAKPYSVYNRRMIELQKKYAYDLWTHINPYTGLAYKDDPVFVMCEVTNECDLFLNRNPIAVEPYAGEFRALFRRWLTEQGKDPAASEGDLNGSDPALLDFKVRVQEEYYREMIAFMREIGVRIPLAGTNWAINAANRKSQLAADFNDSHVYWYNWQWGEEDKRFENRAVSSVPDCGFYELTFCRTLDRPFFVSEWDVPWPAEYRAESPLLMAAVGMLQGWSGFAIHTYSYDTRMDSGLLGKEVSSSSIGGVPYREGVFNTWNDPAKFGLFYHSALITRRGDVAASKNSVEVSLDAPALTPPEATALFSASERSRIGVCFESSPDAAPVRTALVPESDGCVRSDTGELFRSWRNSFGTINTPMTQCAYGMLSRQGEIRLEELSLKVENDFAVIALSSLDTEPIRTADNLLLTAVGRSENTGMRFNEEHTQLLDHGRPPILVENISATLCLRTLRDDLKVWGVNAEGFYTGQIPSEYRDGALRFSIGRQYPSMYYLIRSE